MSKVTNRSLVFFICFLNVLILSCGYETAENWMHLFAKQHLMARREALVLSFGQSENSTRSLASLSPIQNISNPQAPAFLNPMGGTESEGGPWATHIGPDLMKKAHQYFSLRIMREPTNPTHLKNYVDFLWEHQHFSRASAQLDLMISENFSPKWAMKWKDVADRIKYKYLTGPEFMEAAQYWGPSQSEYFAEAADAGNSELTANQGDDLSPEIRSEFEQKYLQYFPKGHSGGSMAINLELQILNGLQDLQINTQALWAKHLERYPDSSRSMVDYTLYLIKQKKIQEAVNWVKSIKSKFSNAPFGSFFSDELTQILAGTGDSDSLMRRYKTFSEMVSNRETF